MPVIARGCALFLLLLLSWPAARAQIIATLDNPATRGADIAVNERTNRVYIASGTESVVEVIDGATSSVVARVPIGSTPKEFGTYMRSEMTKWAKVVKAAGIKAE